MTQFTNLLQLIGFQIVWFAWALGVPAEMIWPGVLASVVFLAAHGLWRPGSTADRFAVIGSVLAGMGLDSLLMGLGWLRFALPNPEPLGFWQPWWMSLLWACLGCTLHHSLAWLKGRKSLAAVLGAVSGVLSYEAASRMGTLTLVEQKAWFALGLFWAAYVPVMQALTQRPSKGDSLG